MNDFRHKIRRGLAVFLALTMCISLAMVPAYAVDENTPSEPVEPVESVDTETVTTGDEDALEEEQEVTEAEQETETVQNPAPTPDAKPMSTPVQAAPVQNELEPQAEDEAGSDESTGSITDETDLIEAVTNGGKVTLSGNITLTKTLTISEDVTLNLAGYTLTGNGNTSVLTIDNSEVTLTGNGTITGGGGKHGGGVFIKGANASLTLESGTISGNTVSEQGGGVFIDEGTFTLEKGGVITQNKAGYSGGGVFVYNYTGTKTAEFIMNGGTISSNEANGGAGVGAYGWKQDSDSLHTVAKLNGGTIEDNSTREGGNGGGVAMECGNHDGLTGMNTIEINGVTIRNNHANQGGGVWGVDSVLTINGAIITENHADKGTQNYGGGVYVQGGEATIYNATITGNNANQGGGLFAGHKTNDTIITVTGGKLYGNTATNHSADVYCNANTTLTLPDASTMGGTLGGKAITGWFWDNSGQYDWSKDYCVERFLTTPTKKQQCLIAAYDLRDPVAKIVETDVEYTTLQAAFDAVTGNQTVIPLEDIVLDAQLVVKADATLDLNGHKISRNLEKGILQLIKVDGGTLTIQDSAGNGEIENKSFSYTASDGKRKTSGIAVFVSSGSLSMQSGKISGYMGIAAQDPNSSVTVNGGQVQGQPAHAMYLNRGASATVNGGTVYRDDPSASGYAIFLWGPGGETSATPTTLTVNGGTIKNTQNAAISGNGSVATGNDARNTKITITDGDITSTESWGIYHPQQGEMTISGGTITGITGLEMRAGTLNVSGDAIITGTSKEYTYDANANGATTKGAGIAVSQHTTERPITATISGGTITGYHAIVEHDLQNNPASEHVTLNIQDGLFVATGADNVPVISDNFTKFITGGTFSSDVSNTENVVYVADPYASHPISEPAGYYNVHTPDIQAGYSHNDTTHWVTGCTGHNDCLEGKSEPQAHIWDNGVVTTDPTPSTPGERTFTCTVCGCQRTEPLNHEHTWATAWTTDANNHWHVCTAEGCTATNELAAHTWGEWVVTTPATTSAPGVETQTCSVCQATQTRPIDQLSGGGGGGGRPSGGGTTTPTPPPTTITDPDVPLAGAPGLNSVDHFAYLAGYPDGTVRPTKNITRAEAATIFLRLMTEDFRVANWSTTHSFTDADAGEWFNTALSVSAKADILRGYSDGTVKPNAAITRAEFATIAARFLGEDATDEGVGDFSDTGSHWAAKDIRRAAKAGWIKGDGNSFRPDDSITRAEVVTIVNRMLDRIPDAEQMLPEMKTWSDNPVGAWYYADVQEASNDHAYERGEDGVTEHWTELTAPMDWNALEAAWIANNGASAPKTDGK